MANKNIKVMTKQDVENELNKMLNTFSGNLCPKSAEARERLIGRLDRRFSAMFRDTNVEYYGLDIDEDDCVAVSYMVEGNLSVFEY